MENEIMNNEELIGATEELTTARNGKIAKVAIGVGLCALVGGIIYKRVVKRIIAKKKAKKSQEVLPVEKNEEEYPEEFLFDPKTEKPLPKKEN